MQTGRKGLLQKYTIHHPSMFWSFPIGEIGAIGLRIHCQDLNQPSRWEWISLNLMFILAKTAYWSSAMMVPWIAQPVARGRFRTIHWRKSRLSTCVRDMESSMMPILYLHWRKH